MNAHDYSETRELLRLLLAGDPKLMIDIYDRYEKKFVSARTRFGQYRYYDAVEAYQRAVLIIIKKIQDKEISVLECSLETYIFSVAKNQLKIINNENKLLLIFDDQLKYDNLTDYTTNTDQLNRIKKYIHNLMKKLSAHDRRIIWYYYFKDYDWKTIAGKMKLDEGYLRKRKCEIMKIMKDLCNEEDLLKLFDE